MKLTQFPTLKSGLVTASAAGLLLATVATANPQEQESTRSEAHGAAQSLHQSDSLQQQAETPAFQEVDQNGDGQAEWSDIESEFQQQLSEANWNEQNVLEQFDRDSDQKLSEQEYDSFRTVLMAHVAANAELDQQSQQAQSEQGQAQQSEIAASGQPQGQQSQGQQSQGQQGNQDVDEALLGMPVAQVNQADVVNSRGESIGQVTQVVRDNSSGDLGVVVRAGGVLGLGGSSVLVDLAELSQMDENQLLWDTMLNQEDIEQMPEFDESQYTEVSENEYSTLQEARDQG